MNGKIMLTAAAVVACVLSVQARTSDEVPVIEVRGVAEREIVPDELTLKIRIDEKDYKGRSTLAQKQEEMVTVLDKCGVDVTEDLKVSYMGSDIKLGLLRSNIKSLVSATYVLEVNSYEQMHKVIEALGEKQISNVSLMKTSCSKEKEIGMELLAEATADARRRAEAVASALGQELGPAVHVYVGNVWKQEEPVLMRSRMMGKAAVNDCEAEVADGASSALLSVQESKFQVEVNVRFGLKP